MPPISREYTIPASRKTHVCLIVERVLIFFWLVFWWVKTEDRDFSLFSKETFEDPFPPMITKTVVL